MVSPPGRPPGAPTGGISVSSPPENRKRKRESSSVVGPPSQSVEQPLSPISSLEPASTNTPVPTAISPDTRPPEVVSEGAEKVSQDLKPSNTPQARQGLVPTSPDEQLRLEEAQSLAAGRTAGSNQDNDGHPTASEVVQEKAPSPSALPKRLAEAAPEVEMPSVPTEAQKPNGEVPAPSVEPSAEEKGAADHVKALPDAIVKREASPIAATLKEAQSIQASQPPPPRQPERMTTRVSSGAIRHKSVSEILGEASRPTPSSTEKTPTPPKTTAAAEKGSSVGGARMSLKERREREKERKKLSTVVFPRQQLEKTESTDLVRRHADETVSKVNEEQDYLYILFQNRAYTPPRGVNLGTLLASAHKTLSTENQYLEYHEQMDCRTLRRIYALQNANKWPLRQLKRSIEPSRSPSHWDVLLDHVKWMGIDFREERKWKIAAAKACADWCAEYVNSDQENRKLLRVPARIPPLERKENDGLAEGHHPNGHAGSASEEVDDEMPDVSHPMPELIPSTEEDSVVDSCNDEPRHDPPDTIAPAALFSLGPEEFTFSMDMTPAADKLLGELPTYAPVSIAPETNMPAFKAPPDEMWKNEILPVTKYAIGHIEYHEDEPVRKRSRYDYLQYDREPDRQKIELPPELTDVALFRPENKPLRDRIHPWSSFKPPIEFPMPSLGFFESRQSSQWTCSEDDELRRLVGKYAYNWSLISSCLTPQSQFTSGAERRTPWECFERWVGLEGLPADIAKTTFFRAYHHRIDTAQRMVLAQQHAQQQQFQQQQQQQGNNPQQPFIPRRRTTQPVRVDRKRPTRHLALLDAMRKLARKRETTVQKQQQGEVLRKKLFCHSSPGFYFIDEHNYMY